MNIQIFGKSKCFETKKAERWFKERGIRYQYIDLGKYAMSRGEFQSARRALGLDGMFDAAAKGAESLRYLAHAADREEKLFENQTLLKTPIVRNGSRATAGYAPETWAAWD